MDWQDENFNGFGCHSHIAIIIIFILGVEILHNHDELIFYLNPLQTSTYLYIASHKLAEIKTSPWSLK